MSLSERAEGALNGRIAPWVLGVVTALMVAWFWGGLSKPGAIHDERAYLVQARLLAHGSWTAPSPPVPLAWEMAHVFVEPKIFAKYPPGHAPILVPGVWLGSEGIVPVLLAGLSAALIFLLARRLTDPWIALLTWGIWTLAPRTLSWYATYFSQTTTAPLWLLAAYALHRWHEREDARWLVVIVASIAWLGISRPVSGIALMIPVAAVVLWTAWRRRSLAGWKPSVVVGALICALVPYWAWRTIGQPFELPYIAYSRWYFPFDFPFSPGEAAPPALRELTPDLQALADATKRLHERYAEQSWWSALLERLGPAMTHPLGIASGLLVFAPIGALVVGWRRSAFAWSSLVLLVASSLIMPQPNGWTIYSLEVFAVPAFFVAVGLIRSAKWLRERRTSSGAPLVRWIPAAHAVVPIILIAAAILGREDLANRKRAHALRSARQELAVQLIKELPDPRAVVFVRRNLPTSPHFTLWDILGPPAVTPTWVVRDLVDSTNAELLAQADGRRGFLLDEDAMTLTAIPRTP